jgi:predicted ribosome quality control (RQC) complex YloA/Tae2 family protein
MNSLSVFELSSFAKWLQNEMQGAQLQDLWTNGQLIVFQFYKFKEMFLLIDVGPQKPLIAYLERRPPVEKKQKPVTLFLNSHGKNLRWIRCSVDLAKGRVLDLELSGGERSCLLQIQLIPKAFNLLVEAGEKKISWEKSRDLPPSVAPESDQDIHQDWKGYGEKWFETKFRPARTAMAPSQGQEKADPRLKAIEKKKKALVVIEEQLQTDSSQIWRDLGEHLKIASDVPSQFAKIYDSQKSRSWNMEHAFEQAKLQQRKKAGTRERLEKLKAEISELERNIQEQPVPSVMAPQASMATKLLEKTEAKGRRIQLDNGFEAVMGKSARDNLAILRRAQAWDLWLHLKDHPGAHAIIIRPRQKEVSPNLIQKVSEWLIRESLSHQKIQWGAKYDVVVVECRYVRPIKGDKLGRVTYHNPQVYSFASKA